MWHGSPVWFIDENPVVGYKATVKAVGLLFWNGQAFDEPALSPVGKYRSAHAVFSDAAEIDPEVVRRWLKKAGADVFDSTTFFKKLRERTRRHPRDQRPAAARSRTGRAGPLARARSAR